VEVKAMIGKKIRTFLIVFPISYFKMSYTFKHHHQMTLEPKQALVITAPELLEPKGHNIIRETHVINREKNINRAEHPASKKKKKCSSFSSFLR
jgi:hypothetical protein